MEMMTVSMEVMSLQSTVTQKEELVSVISSRVTMDIAYQESTFVMVIMIVSTIQMKMIVTNAVSTII